MVISRTSAVAEIIQAISAGLIFVLCAIAGVVMSIAIAATNPLIAQRVVTNIGMMVPPIANSDTHSALSSISPVRIRTA